jgi:hypothetical protein
MGLKNHLETGERKTETETAELELSLLKKWI